MWTFQQSTGRIITPEGFHTANGWAGQREGKNNPAAQDRVGIGPLPRGEYTILAPHDSPHTGPFTMDLTPDPTNEMFGRSLFRIHGAAKVNPELSSEGCIVAPHSTRQEIWMSGDRRLRVVA